MASMLRQWKKSGKFLVTCLVCVFIIEMIVHEGKPPFHTHAVLYETRMTDYEIRINDAIPIAGQPDGFGPAAHPLIRRPSVTKTIRQESKSIQVISKLPIQQMFPTIATPKPNIVQTKAQLANKAKGKPAKTAAKSAKTGDTKPKLETFMFKDIKASWTDRVNDLVNRLSIEEIILQSVAFYSKATPGISRLGIKPFVWISECLSGQTSTYGTAFPQSLALAATFR